MQDGYTTLARMDGAHNYNAWLGRQFRPHLGKRVLEVGAGIGTITQEIQSGRDLVIALEVEQFYVDKLSRRFADHGHVRPYLSGVEKADWQALRSESLDTVVCSNVLEHIEDDRRALLNFREVLAPGGRLVLFVPALQVLFGSLDEAVGHHRRYHADGLSRLLLEAGYQIETLRWMNLVGIPGWFLNGRIFKRRAVPAFQLRLFDAVAPLLAAAESVFRLPVGMGLFAVAKTT